jgi:hypothetical protein
MARTKDVKWTEIHLEAVKEFDKIQTALRDERLQCLQDRRFYSISGAQWEGPLGVQFENKPRLEVNKVHLSVIRIINEYRNNRITVEFVSKEGDKKESLSDTCASLYRADEQDSVAQEAHDNGFEEAIGGGFGAWRLRTRYVDESDEDDERQRICIEPIYDADSSVFFDLDAKRQDKADAKRCYVMSAMTRSAYKDEWGEEPTSLQKTIYQLMFDWLTPDVVYIAEYYKVEEKSTTVHIYAGLDSEEKRYTDAELADDVSLEDTLHATGFREIRQKKVKVKRIHKYIISGGKVLEDCGYIAGKNIPVVPVYGKRWFVDNVERCMGHVRLAKDSQRLKNMQLSKLAEISAVSSIEKPIFTPEQIAGHQVMWAEDNIENYPYMLVNQLTDMNGNPALVGPSQFTKSPQVPPPMAALLALTETDMQDVLGNQQAGEQLQSNISGKAVELIQGKLDMQAFIYMSNMAKAIKRSGEIWLSMAQEVYVETGRKMKGIGEQGQISAVELQKPMIGENGELKLENDLSEADFDLVTDIGPSSASRRQSIVRSLTGMMQMTQDPETMQVLAATAMMNMEGEGIQDIRDYFRQKLIRIGAVKPTEEEMKKLQQEQANTPPDPQAQFLQASAQQAAAQAQKAQADAVLSIARSKESEAKVAEIFGKMDVSQKELLFKLLKEIGGGEQPGSETLTPQATQSLMSGNLSAV